MSDILSFISSFVSFLLVSDSDIDSISIFDNFVYFISSFPGLLLFVLIPFVGLGIGLIKRIIKLN